MARAFCNFSRHVDEMLDFRAWVRIGIGGGEGSDAGRILGSTGPPAQVPKFILFYSLFGARPYRSVARGRERGKR